MVTVRRAGEVEVRALGSVAPAAARLAHGRGVLEPGLAPRAKDGLRRARLPDIGRARRDRRIVALGASGEKQHPLGFVPATGRFTIGGKTAREGRMREALAIYGAAELVAAGTDLAPRIGRAADVKERTIAELESMLSWTLEGRFTVTKEKAFAGAQTLLFNLARSPATQDRDLFRRAVGAMIDALSRVRDPELRGFYFIGLDALKKSLPRAELARLEAIGHSVLPRRPLVDEYTAGRTRPLEVRHFIHPEFWKEELRLFTKKDGWTLVKKNAHDTERVYAGRLKDPLGKKPPLEVNLVVKQGELDYLDAVADPNVHVLTYSGHSAVGGNGSEAIENAGKMVGAHPKLIFAANCRGKDNYAALTDKWPEAHVISTEHPTYSENGQAQLRALFQTLAAGQSYAWMRSKVGPTQFDEPANNYFYPDERRKFRFMDADEDGRSDGSRLVKDRLFDVHARLAGAQFDRALAFTNSELFYHWEVDAENGLKSHYGRKFGDALEAAGPFFGAKKGELVRVEKVAGGDKRAARYLVSFAPKLARKMDENKLAAYVTACSVMALAKLSNGGVLLPKEALRAALMGAQAIHYLDVYVDSQPRTYRRYFRDIGLAKNIDARDIERIFDRFDAHANDEQLAAFQKLLEHKYGFDLARWTPKLDGAPAVVRVS